MPRDLNDIRTRLDAIDGAIIEALASRQQIIDEVAQHKAASERPIRDFEREEALLDRLGGLAEDTGLDRTFVASIYERILDYSVRYQTDHLTDQYNPGHASERRVVAFQGTDGSYSHLAARHHFSSRPASHAYHGYGTFAEAVSAVEVGEADCAVLPIENTTAGSINDTYDLLAASSLVLVGEEVIPITLCLVALEEVPLGLIRRISSHPQAIAQCSTFLASLKDCEVKSYLDSALAVRKVWEESDLSHAAIASEEAARRFGLHVVRRDIANHHENYTRYVIVAREPVHYDLRIPCKTSLIFATPHAKGALMQCLSIFDRHGLNLCKLESRPRPRTPWEYLFYVDIEGNRDDAEVGVALAELECAATLVRVLGTYPGRTNEPPRPTCATRNGSAVRAAGDGAAKTLAE